MLFLLSRGELLIYSFSNGPVLGAQVLKFTQGAGVPSVAYGKLVVHTGRGVMLRGPCSQTFHSSGRGRKFLYIYTAPLKEIKTNLPVRLYAGKYSSHFPHLN